MSLRVVFDTSTVLSALLFSSGRLAWLRAHWRSGECTPLLSRETAAELARALSYPKFKLSSAEQMELLGDYVPYTHSVEKTKRCPVICRDPNDQHFLDLAYTGRAAVLVSSDRDLLTLAGKTEFEIENPEDYRQRFSR